MDAKLFLRLGGSLKPLVVFWVFLQEELHGLPGHWTVNQVPEGSPGPAPPPL